MGMLHIKCFCFNFGLYKHNSFLFARFGRVPAHLSVFGRLSSLECARMRELAQRGCVHDR